MHVVCAHCSVACAKKYFVCVVQCEPECKEAKTACTERKMSFIPTDKTGDYTSAIPTPPLSLAAFSCPDPHYHRGKHCSACVHWGEDLCVRWMCALFFFQGNERRTLSEPVKDLSCEHSVIYSPPLRGMLFAGWSSGVLTRLLALTCCQDGLQTSVCVFTLGAGKQEVTNVLTGRPLPWTAWTYEHYWGVNGIYTHTHTHTQWSDLCVTL